MDDDLLGARASRPHKAWHSLVYFRDFDRPRTAPLLPFCLADAVPAGRVTACRIALKLSGRQSAKAAGCPQRRKPGRRGEASMGSQAQPGGEPRSRGLGAVGQGARGGGGVGRNRMRAGRPRSQGLPSGSAGGECLAGDFLKNLMYTQSGTPFASATALCDNLQPVRGGAQGTGRNRPFRALSSSSPDLSLENSCLNP